MEECFISNKIKVKFHVNLIKLDWFSSTLAKGFALTRVQHWLRPDMKVLVFITDIWLNLSILINHYFKVSS